MEGVVLAGVLDVVADRRDEEREDVGRFEQVAERHPRLVALAAADIAGGGGAAGTARARAARARAEREGTLVGARGAAGGRRGGRRQLVPQGKFLGFFLGGHAQVPQGSGHRCMPRHTARTQCREHLR